MIQAGMEEVQISWNTYVSIRHMVRIDMDLPSTIVGKLEREVTLFIKMETLPRLESAKV